ncbi:GNAT family N-acetyltransferase [Terrimicrobium sacchariphilum]|nr:GNAT family N-acetyltransferase [Terrimicrobium sacchariphilum]
MDQIYSLHTDRNIEPWEFGQLAALNLWGDAGDFTGERLAGHFAAVDFAAHVRTSQHLLVGYASAISNGLGTVFIDSLICHPEYDREAIGGLLLRAVLTHFSGQPVYAMPFVDEQQVFRANGFRVYRREMVALAHRNDEPSGLGGIAAPEAVIHS